MRVTTYKTVLNKNGLTELVKESAVNYGDQKIAFDCPQRIVELMTNVFALQMMAEEYYYMLCFNTKGNLIGVFEVSHGTVNTTLTTPRETFMRALLCGAVSVAFVHNHPSGDTTPSREDIGATKRLQEAGKILGIPVLDHIIIGSDGSYVSMKELELME